MKMIDNILTVGTQVMILLVLIAIGYILGIKKVLNENAVRCMTNLVLYTVTPCVIIKSFMREFDMAMLKNLIITFIAASVWFIVDIVLANLIIHDKDKKRENVLRFGLIFSNCGYMSIPLQQALLGDDGVFYGAVFIAVFNIIVWTYGVCLMEGSTKHISLKKIFINPGIIGTTIGLILFLSSVQLPSVVTEPIGYLAAINTPIPMIIIGYHLVGASFKITGKNTWISIVFRLIVSPLIFLAGMYVCGIRGTVLITGVIATSAPWAANTTMFAQKYDADVPLSAACVSVTTLLSILTMPIIVGIAIMMK